MRLLFYFLLLSLSLYASANDDITTSLSRFESLNKQHKTNCSNLPKPALCPTVLKNLNTEDQEDSFLGLLKSRYSACTKSLKPNVSLPSAEVLKNKFNFLEDQHMSVIEKCDPTANKKIHNTNIKYLFYLNKINTAYSKMQFQYLKTQQLLNTKNSCSNFALSSAIKFCEANQQCFKNDTIDKLTSEVEKDETLLINIKKELTRIQRTCRSEDCTKYQQSLKLVLTQLVKKNPWFSDDDYSKELGNGQIKNRLLRYHKTQSENENKFLKDSRLYLDCISGKTTCDKDNLRTFFEFLPDQSFPRVRDQTINPLYEALDAQTCVEEGTNDRLKTNRILTSSARDAALTVATLGIGSIPALAKVGLSARAATQLRLGGETVDLSLNGYFALSDFTTALNSCLNAPNIALNAAAQSSCALAKTEQFNQATLKNNCGLDSSLALLATLPLGLQFMQLSKIKIPVSSSRTFSQNTILNNANLSRTDRILEYEKLLGLKKGSLLNDPIKADAIMKAHNMPGKIGELTFSQIRSRVDFLKKSGFTSDEIRIGLNAGIFGNPPIANGIVARLSASSERSLAPFLNSDLANAKVITAVSDTKATDGRNLQGFTGENNAGIEVLEHNGRKLFAKIKFPPSSSNLSPGQLKELEERFLNEVDYVKKLSDLGVGPKFHGVVKGQDGKYRIVTDFVDGYEVHLGETPENLSQISFATLNDINEKSKKLIAAGIDPLDLQFRVDKAGKAHVIDPEYFGKLSPAETSGILKDLNTDLQDLRWDKLKMQSQPRQYQITPTQAETTVKFNIRQDYSRAVAQGKVTDLETLTRTNAKPQGSYNYVVYEDGSMSLAKVDNEWQYGVSHRQLSNGKKVVGMGEVKIDDKRNAIFSVAPKVIENDKISNGLTINTTAMTQLMTTKLKSHGLSTSVADFTQTLVPSRKPSFSELVSYCASSHFKAANELLCRQLDNL